jgi:hypothetical protein
MKKIITILLIGFSLGSFAQNGKIAIKATNLIDPDLRLLYIGIDNPVSLENNNDTNVFLRITKGSCSKTGNHLYNIRVSIIGKTTIEVLKKTPTRNILIDTANFNVLKVPDPIAIFGNLVDTMATVNALMIQKEIKTFMPCYYNIRFRILCFTVSVIRLNGSSESITTTGNIISDQQNQILKSLKPGDRLLIEDIKAVGSGGCTRTLAPISIRVKLR